MSAATRYLAIDPGKVTGFAYRLRGLEKIEAGVTCASVLPAIIEVAVTCDATAAVIEDVYLGINPATYRALIETRMEIVRQCEDAGLYIRDVHPVIWKRAMLTVSGHFPKTRDEQKRVAIWVAKHALGVDCHGDDNIGDAACILAWAEATPWEDGP